MRHGPPVRLRVRLGGADLLRDRDGVHLLFDPDPAELAPLELGGAVREDPDLQSSFAQMADRLDGVVVQLDQVDRACAGVVVGGQEIVAHLAPRLEPVADVVPSVGVEVDLAPQEQLVMPVGELERAPLELVGVEAWITLGKALRDRRPELPPGTVVVDEREVEVEEDAANRHCSDPSGRVWGQTPDTSAGDA